MEKKPREMPNKCIVVCKHSAIQNIKLIPLFPLLFVPCIAFAQQAPGIDQAIEQAGIFFSEKLTPKSKVAILNIESDSPKISSYIMGELSAMLVNERSLVIVERRDLDLIQQEEQFQMSGGVSDATAQRIGQKLGAQIILSGSFANLGSQYRLRIWAIAVETAQIQETYTSSVRPDKTLRGLEQEPRQGSSNGHFLYLGGRVGLSTGFYNNAGGLADRTLYPSQSISGIPAFDGALFFSAALIKLLEIQAEVLITNDSFDLISGKNTLFTVSYNSIMIPMLAKLVFRPSIFMIQVFAGPYLSLPIGQVKVKHSNGSYTADFSLLGGIMAGGEFGIKLGPGTLLADIRYAGDFNNVTITNNGTKDISKRNKVYFSLGYEFALIPK